jgi:isopentenyldiphosphate isomerase
MSIVSRDMLIDSVTDNDRLLGVVRRDEVFKRRANFRVVHILVFSSRGDLLVQRLANSRNRHPGSWGSSVAGYLFAGEGYQAAAERRLAEELGVNSPLNYIGKTVTDDEGCHKFIAVFSTIHDGPFEYDNDHIESVEFLSLALIRELRMTEARKFTPTFLRVLDFYQMHRV